MRTTNNETRMDSEPNAETLEAFHEVEEMKKHPSQYKAYNSVDELFEDLDA